MNSLTALKLTQTRVPSCITLTKINTFVSINCRIVFIDEIDKIVSSRSSSFRTGDPSSEGVQRDLLPIIEGDCEQNRQWANAHFFVLH